MMLVEPSILSGSASVWSTGGDSNSRTWICSPLHSRSATRAITEPFETESLFQIHRIKRWNFSHRAKISDILSTNWKGVFCTLKREDVFQRSDSLPAMGNYLLGQHLHWRRVSQVAIGFSGQRVLGTTKRSD